MIFVLLLYTFLTAFSIENKQFIKNFNVPICKNCVYFRPYKNDVQLFDLGKCTKFGKMDIISGIIAYKYAFDCRNSENLCTFNGTFFEERKHPNITLSILQSEWLNE
jgi:hypothetical protein